MLCWAPFWNGWQQFNKVSLDFHILVSKITNCYSKSMHGTSNETYYKILSFYEKCFWNIQFQFDNLHKLLIIIFLNPHYILLLFTDSSMNVGFFFKNLLSVLYFGCLHRLSSELLKFTIRKLNNYIRLSDWLPWVPTRFDENVKNIRLTIFFFWKSGIHS